MRILEILIEHHVFEVTDLRWTLNCGDRRWILHGVDWRKMGRWYINQTFFFDLPPGKMLIGLSGKLTGYGACFWKARRQWIIKKYSQQPDLRGKTVDLVIHLEPALTTRNLQSHKEPAPVTKGHNQVTCYEENGTGDANNIWRIEVVRGAPGEMIQMDNGKFKLIHYFTGCALHSHSKQLPKRGYEQIELSCNPNVHASARIGTSRTTTILPLLPIVM
ncbi:hypothetical protein HPB47_020513 [Ixodes persulcatus]|uniref:Uncharacterized protein n=1 Tax=Ixodes persulcatus TaxID=34615 RepID=A0AC60QF98_IXOPE|nr:hypothetical protein HPB47_020513 [Ixodes persulcatus]